MCKMVEIPERLRWGPVAVEWDVWGLAGGEPVEQGLQLHQICIRGIGWADSGPLPA